MISKNQKDQLRSNLNNIITIRELETLEAVRHFSDKEAISKGYVSEATLLSRAFSLLPKSYKQVQTLVTGPKGKHTTLQTRVFRYGVVMKINLNAITYYCDNKTGTLYTNTGKCLSSSQLSIV